MLITGSAAALNAADGNRNLVDLTDVVDPTVIVSFEHYLKPAVDEETGSIEVKKLVTSGGGPGQPPEVLAIITDTTVTETAPAVFDIVTINVGGRRFQTFAGTLLRYPDTLLGNPIKRARHYNAAQGEYFFDRHRACFESILYFYQSRGRLRRPECVPVDIFVNEMRFFEMGPQVLEKFWIQEGYRKPKHLTLPRNKMQRCIWELMEHPDSSMCARIIAFFSVFVIVLSTTSFCLETIPDLGDRFQKGRHNVTPNGTNMTGNSGDSDDGMDWSNPFCVIEFSCICWFTFEFILRFSTCPEKCQFMKSFLNIIDLMAIVPFFFNWILQGQNLTSQNSSAMSFTILRVFRLVRVFRIFKLSRHSRGLQILGKTFKASVQELCLLVFFMMIALVLFSSAVYFAESNRATFQSIPAAFWFSIATMTTVGYGDLVPKTPSGKLVGGMCALVGVLVLALPVPVIVANFKHFYRQETRLAHMNRLEQTNIDILEKNDGEEDNASVDNNSNTTA